ncbi:MAG TPA: hypothetical protein VI669_18995 [Vicinamibacteria bacterium]
MLKLILAGAVAVPMAGAGAVAATGVAWVDVREGGRDGMRIVLPVPLALVQTAAAFVPDQKKHLRIGEAARYLPVAREALQALADGPDGELVRVEERDEQVVIAKVGRSLHIQVKDHGEDVEVNVPIEVALQALGEDGTLSPMRAIGALRQARLTKLVEVNGRDGERVKISIW